MKIFYIEPKEFQFYKELLKLDDCRYFEDFDLRNKRKYKQMVSDSNRDDDYESGTSDPIIAMTPYDEDWWGTPKYKRYTYYYRR